MATWCEELTHLKRHWCWEGLGAGGEGDDRGWDGWMASPNRWTWVWVNSGSWWWTGRPGVLRFTGLQRVGHDWATELNWTEPYPRWQYSSVESSRQQLSSPCKQVIFLNSVFCVQFLTKVKDNAQRPNYKHYQARQEVFQGLPQLLTTVRNTDIVSTSKKESDFTFTFHFHALEKEMATPSSVLAWRIPGMGKPGGLPSMGLHRVGHDWSNLAEAAASCI